MKQLRARYGAGPLHLLGLVASFAIAGAAVIGWFERPQDIETILIWLAGAIVLHDMVLYPLYTLVDRVAFGRWSRGARPDATTSDRTVSPVPYLRIPALLSGLLLLVFFPVIFGLGAQAELTASGIAEHGYLARWLLACGVMFAVSGVAYAAVAGRVRAQKAAAARMAADARAAEERLAADE